MNIELSKNPTPLHGHITLNGSKSISNRVLIIYALCADDFPIRNLSNARDTVALLRLLQHQGENVLDAGDAGTTFRFMTAYLAFQHGKHVLMGSSRMLQRPIAPLVEALQQLGARISYVGQVGYPPIQICTPIYNGCDELRIDANVSSQFITALLLIAPTLPNGLRLTLAGEVVSRPYINMTLRLMEQFGVRHTWEADTITIQPQAYQAQPFAVEADWSAASYYYALMALSSDESSQLILNGLQLDSVQGDSVLMALMQRFGVFTEATDAGLRLQKTPVCAKYFEYNFLSCPDIAQTIAVVCAGLGIPAHLTGLQTLKIKETDRIAALQTELQKLGCVVHTTDSSLTIERGIDTNIDTKSLVVNTYNDHRMAMAFAPLAMKLPSLRFDSKEVVAKSYPEFWNDLKILGFRIK